jgi:hypothetical protein
LGSIPGSKMPRGSIPCSIKRITGSASRQNRPLIITPLILRIGSQGLTCDEREEAKGIDFH